MELDTLPVQSPSEDRTIADAEELHRFSRSESADRQLTPQLRGILAETALHNIVRYDWELLKPLLHVCIDDAIAKVVKSIEEQGSDSPGVLGPPRPPLDTDSSSCHALLEQFDGPPFTIQRLSEVLLEPTKQYKQPEKLIHALERLLLVTSLREPRINSPLPPLPALASLGPVNKNPHSPYLAGAGAVTGAEEFITQSSPGEREDPNTLQDGGGGMDSFSFQLKAEDEDEDEGKPSIGVVK